MYKTNYTSLLFLLREITNENKEVENLFPVQASSLFVLSPSLFQENIKLSIHTGIHKKKIYIGKAHSPR